VHRPARTLGDPLAGTSHDLLTGRLDCHLYVNVKVVIRSGEMSDAQTPTLAQRLLRINEVAAETGLTTRAIRYYEEMGLLEPAARSEGDYRLYDASDLDRLTFIRSLRDDAGFSLAQIGQLLEDEAARERNRERLRQTSDPRERRIYLLEAQERIERQITLLEAKAARLASMIDEAQARLVHVRSHVAELDATEPAPPVAEARSRGGA
jgi:DNA-binding transcriptional MerR regulator